MEQLTELRLGSSTEVAYGFNNTFTIVGFEAILRSLNTMRKLIVLDMQLPHVNELNINGMSIY
jgi:hypothetical protein